MTNSGALGQKFREIDLSKTWKAVFEVKIWESLYEKLRLEFTSEPKKNLKITYAKLPQNLSLNRYVNVLPYDHSIVKLSDGGYINANRLKKDELGRHYILAQGPLPQTSVHFWQMVWDENVSCIIMLTRIIEQSQIKCHMYFPGTEVGPNGCQVQGSITFGDFQIDLKREDHERNYSKRLFQLKNKTNAVREINHFQFNTWPDFGVPEKTDDFLEFLSEIRKTDFLNCYKFGPVVCHCSAGIGRSGTFILADTALAKVQKTKDASKVDIKQMVMEYRRFRYGLIQTPDQLRFAWKSVVDALDSDRWKGIFVNPSSPDVDTNRIAVKRPTMTPSPSPPICCECSSSSSPLPPTTLDMTPTTTTSLTNDNSSPKRPKPGPNGDASSSRASFVTTSTTPSPISNKTEDVECSKSLPDVDSVDRSR